MRLLSTLFLALGLIAFIPAILIRFKRIDLGMDPKTFIELCQMGLLASIACGIAALRAGKNG